MTPLPLGRLLVDTGALSASALEEVLEAQKGSGKRLGDLLVERGLVGPDQLAQLLSNQLGFPWVRLAHVTVEPAVLALVPREIALAHHVLPVHLSRVGNAPRLFVAADDPTDTVALAACARSARMPVRAMVALGGDLRDAITRAYGEAPALVKVRASLLPGSGRDSLPEIVDDGDIVDVLDAGKRPCTTVLALNAPDRFLATCREAVAPLGATVIDGSLVRAAELAVEHAPCAIVVTEDVFAFDRGGLEKLALDRDAVLVAWNEDAEARQLSPLLVTAVLRASRAAYEPGAVVDARYELLRELDSPVARARWEVRHVRTARRALLELGVAELGSSTKAKQVALAKVTHPGAPELRDAGTTETGDPYLVVELVDGRSLDALFAAGGAFSTEEACSIGAEVGEILAAAHAAGVSHAGVRLANVILARDAWGTERARLIGWERAGGPEGAAADVAALGRVVLELVGEAGAAALRPLVEEAGADARALADALAKRGAEKPREMVPSRRPPPTAEQRRFPRASYRTPVRLEVTGFGSVDGRTEDISVGGLLVVARAEVEPGTKLNVRFALPVDGRLVTEMAVVRWARSAHKDDAAGLRALGIELTSAAPETIAQIERYVTLIGAAP